jgi:hypothetical protein
VRGNLTYENGVVDFVEDVRGIVEVYRFPTDSTKGAIGVDISQGIGSDRSSASFLNWDTLTEDIVINTSKLDPSEFAIQTWLLGHWTNKSLVCVESNGPGLACILPLINGQKEYAPYKNLYYQEVLDQETRKKTKKFGWTTSGKTKPVMIDKLAELVRENLITIPSMETIRELQCFVIEEDGKMNAVEGMTDDRVLALSMAVMMHALRPTCKLPDKPPTGQRIY